VIENAARIEELLAAQPPIPDRDEEDGADG
jgi:hypothetical protein